MGHVGKIATNVLLAFVALLVGRYLVIDMPFTGDTLLQATYYALGALIVELVFRVERAPWRFVSASDHLRLFRSAVLTAAAFMVITRMVHPGIDGGLRTVAGAAL
ncbi:MAG: polysaccharide biosynthesis protein, partial [Caulobacter sp.]|nr:polysaccharide biosynthesis protein [Caulobacter sp.]